MRESYDFARRSVEEGSMGAVLWNFTTIVSNFITALGMLFVFFYLNGCIVFLLILVIILSAVDAAKRMNIMLRWSRLSGVARATRIALLWLVLIQTIDFPHGDIE